MPKVVWVKCEDCKGKGRVLVAGGSGFSLVTCTTCDGTGRVPGVE